MYYTSTMRGVCAWAVILMAAWCPVAASAQAPPEPSRPSFAEFLDGVRAEALGRGIRREIVDEALGHIAEPLPVVIERDRSQAEAVFSLDRYIARLLTRTFLTTARARYSDQRTLAGDVAARYGVDPGIIVGIWGIESNFGRFSGVRPTIVALATLAWDPRRATLFRRELFDALEILNRGDIELARMRGSWAGAMGQSQFMPSSYLQFAEDFDGDGRRDIWGSIPDVFASIANYLKGHGWADGRGWGREVSVSPDAARTIASAVARREGSCRALSDMTIALPMTRWRELGVRLPRGGALPASDAEASLVSGSERHFLVTGNYDALLAYNCSHAYALSVALIADSVTSSAPIVAAPAAHRRRTPTRKAARKRTR